MAKKSGSDFENHYDGSKTTDGYTRHGSTYTKHDGGDTYKSKKESRNGRSRDHAHFYNDSETGERQVSVSRERTYEDGSKHKHKVNSGQESDLFSGIKYFLGID